MRVVAVEKADDAAPVEAVVVSEDRPRQFLGWWGGYASETIDIGSVETLVQGDPKWRPFEMDLPSDWEEGYLASTSGRIEFVRGPVPVRTEWLTVRRAGEWWRLLLLAGIVAAQFAAAANAIGDLPTGERPGAWRLYWLVFLLALLGSVAATVWQAARKGLIDEDEQRVKAKTRRMQDMAKTLMWPLVGVALITDDLVPPRYLAALFAALAGYLLPLVPVAIYVSYRTGRLWRQYMRGDGTYRPAP